jgi:hypothetical protein
MNIHKHETKVALATVILVGYVLALSTITQVMSALQASTKVSNTGSLMTVGVGVYSDSACTTKITSLNWGTLAPGSNVNQTVFIKNEGNAVATLSMAPSNWSPASASSYMTLTWNYNGQTLSVGQVVQVKFTLTISSSVTGITTFSFDITITATS